MASSTAANSGATQTGAVSSDLKTTVPMTARFTPPSFCSSSWTYEPSQANNIEGGLLIQNAAPSDNVDPSCWPSGFEHYGRAQPTQVFSPGYCPLGYTSAGVAIEQPVTSAACCLSGYTYAASIAQNNGLTYAGCTKLFPSGSSTIVTVRETSGYSTQVTGAITMWAQPILVQLESSDMSLFTTTTTTQNPWTSVMPSITNEAVHSTGTVRPTEASQSTPITSGSPPNSGLSTGAKTGIGVGVGVGGLGLGALVAAIFLFRRRKRSNKPFNDASDPRQSHTDETFSQTQKTPVPTYVYAAELDGSKYSSRGGNLPPAELEAWS